jgi:tetratricopeptide (TPR) repeat protein
MLKDVPPQTIHKKVYVLHRLNKFNAALHLLEEIIWESPYPETIIQYAEIQAQLGKNKKALEYIEIGRTRFGDDHRFLALAGMIHYLSGHYMLACRFFHLVDHADENTWRSRYLFMYAKSSLFIGFIDKGISLLEEFLLRMNQDIDVFRFYLIEMFKAGRISSAEQFLSTLEESGKVKGITLTSMKLSLNYYLELGKPPR